MEITKMRADKLRTWIKNLENTIKYEEDPRNIAIYVNWLNEAYAEQKARYERRENYLNEKYQDTKRGIYRFKR